MSRKFRRFLWLSAVAVPFACSIPDERHTQNDDETQGGNAGAHWQPSAGVNMTLWSSLGGTAIQSSMADTAATAGGNAQVVSSAAAGSAAANTATAGFSGTGAVSVGGTLTNTSLAKGGGTQQVGLNKDCTSTSDNDRNGFPDNTESVCTLCGQSRACDAHPGYDGVGECHAGSQSATMAADRSSCTWGACTGSQGPTTEKCGLSADGRLLDTNCNGKPGDGEYNTTACLTTSPFYLFRVQYNTSNFVPLLHCSVTVTAEGPHNNSNESKSNTCYYYAFEKCSEGTVASTVGYALRLGGSITAAPSKYRQLAVPKGTVSCSVTAASTTTKYYPLSPTYADSCSNCTANGLYVLPPP